MNEHILNAEGLMGRTGVIVVRANADFGSRGAEICF